MVDGVTCCSYIPDTYVYCSLCSTRVIQSSTGTTRKLISFTIRTMTRLFAGSSVTPFDASSTTGYAHGDCLDNRRYSEREVQGRWTIECNQDYYCRRRMVLNLLTRGDIGQISQIYCTVRKPTNQPTTNQRLSTSTAVNPPSSSSFLSDSPPRP